MKFLCQSYDHALAYVLPNTALLVHYSFKESGRRQCAIKLYWKAFFLYFLGY